MDETRTEVIENVAVCNKCPLFHVNHEEFEQYCGLTMDTSHNILGVIDNKRATLSPETVNANRETVYFSHDCPLNRIETKDGREIRPKIGRIHVLKMVENAR